MITLIVARAHDGAIGRDGTIPWVLPEDLRFFQRETVGGALIMGRNTWKSLPVKPLTKRLNIVVSSNPDVADIVVPDVQSAIQAALNAGYQRIYGIGGARIYAELLPIAHRLLISEVSVRVPDADTFFPAVASELWVPISERLLRPSEPACLLREYLRRRTTE